MRGARLHSRPKSIDIPVDWLQTPLNKGLISATEALASEERALRLGCAQRARVRGADDFVTTRLADDASCLGLLGRRSSPQEENDSGLLSR